MLPVLFTNSVSPTRPEARPANRLAALFDPFSRGDFFAPPAGAVPLAVWQDENHVYVEMDAPGLTPDDIELTVHDGALLIQGERKDGGREALYDGRCYGRFARRVDLPSEVDAGRVEAGLSNGVLAVTLPKSADGKPRKIAVRAG